MSCREQSKCHLIVLTVTIRIYLSNPFKAYPQVARAWKVLSILVKGNCHNTVCGVESLLYTIPMMDVNVYVQNSLVVSGKRGGIMLNLITFCHSLKEDILCSFQVV